KRPTASGVDEQAGEFVAQTVGSYGFDCTVLHCLRYGVGSLFVILETELILKADGTHDTQGVFGDAIFGIAEKTNSAGFQVGDAADIVNNFAGGRIERQSINREVTAQYVFL